MSADPMPLPPVSVAEAALRDAEKIAARIAADDAAAADARRAYEVDGLPAIEPDAGARAILIPGELLHAIRASALLEASTSGEEETLPRGGTLYLTSPRVVHLGAETTELPLSQIDEVTVALE